MTSDLRNLYARGEHRPLVTAIARAGGLLGREAGIADSVERVDPLELVRQRAQRDMAWQLIEAMGWTLELKPPGEPAKKPQAFADSDTGGGRDA